MHIHKNPLLLGTLPPALEGGFDVFLSVVASQGKADPTENYLGVSSKRIIVPKRLVSRGIPSQHSHSIMKLVSAETMLVLR
jgi:hypothetical protein